MRRALSWLAPLLLASAAVAGVSGCFEEGDVGAPASLPESAYARITGEDGAEGLSVEGGLIRAELRVGHVEALRTVGLKVHVEGADIVEWERDDAFLRSAGGNVLTLESKVDGPDFRLIAGTTAPVSTDDDARLATLVLRPTAATVRLSVSAEGSDLGLVADGGRRLDVTVLNASLEQVGR